MKTLISIFLLSILPSLNIFAQQKTFQDTLLDRITGDWTLRGTIANQKTTHDVRASWVLGHQYIQIHEVSHEKDTTGNPAYEALVYIGWNSELKQYTCLWLDITGSNGLSAQAIASGVRKGDEITFLFKDSDESSFHTTFVYNRSSNTWQWIMDNEENGKLLPFARVKLTRK